ncbi:MAG: response regulator transcription factor [Rhizobiales bacterium]|nr:response regulator transcription factor [Hyphomicrobiales bacterium]
MKILVVEDDRRILTFLKRALEAEGHHVTVAEDGRDGLERIRSEPFELMILDRMLPYVDGLEVCRMVRKERHAVLILMLTAKDGLQDKVEGLRGGADENEALRVGPLMLDPAAHRVTVDGREVALTLREFELLRYLMANAGRVVSRQRLLNSVWEYSFEPGTKVVDVYIRYLRKKIGDEDGALIQTIRGIGYMLRRPDAA